MYIVGWAISIRGSPKLTIEKSWHAWPMAVRTLGWREKVDRWVDWQIDIHSLATRHIFLEKSSDQTRLPANSVWNMPLVWLWWVPSVAEWDASWYPSVVIGTCILTTHTHTLCRVQDSYGCKRAQFAEFLTGLIVWWNSLRVFHRKKEGKTFRFPELIRQNIELKQILIK